MKAAKVDEVLERHLGTTIKRFRNNSKRSTRWYRAAEGSPGKVTFLGANGDKVEILGDGQQSVVWGASIQAAFGYSGKTAERRGTQRSPTCRRLRKSRLKRCGRRSRQLSGRPKARPASLAHPQSQERAGERPTHPTILKSSTVVEDFTEGGYNNTGYDEYIPTLFSAIGVRNTFEKRGAPAEIVERATDAIHALVASGAKYREKDDADVDRLIQKDDGRSGSAVFLGWAADQGVPSAIAMLDKIEADRGQRTVAVLVGLADEDDLRPEAAEIAAGFWDPWDKLVPPPFPVDCLPTLLREVVWDTHRRIGADLGATAMAFLPLSLVPLIAGLRCKFRRHGSWVENPRLWVMLVGDPSAKKTPTINAAMWPLDGAEKQAMIRHRADKEIWDTTPREERGPEPTPPVYRLNDPGPEAGEPAATLAAGVVSPRR